MIGMEAVKKELVSFYNIARLEKLREQQLGISANDSRSYNFILYVCILPCLYSFRANLV